MPQGIDLLCSLIANPQLANRLTPSDWTDVIPLARDANLLGTLAERMAQAGVSSGCNADRHLAGARQLSERQRRSVRWEAQMIQNALAELCCPIVLLKGAAYSLGEHANSLGRLFGDIDILVPADRLGEVEIRLMVNGWAPVVTTQYDERYYRQWMHELPPMAHARRGSVIDVHHTILPPTARLRPDPAKIIAHATPLPGLAALFIPCTEDLIIHSIVHLVHEGSVDNGLRDLCDIWQLRRATADDPEFEARLTARAQELGLDSPVSMGLNLVNRFFADRSASSSRRLLDARVKRRGYGRIAESLFVSAVAGISKSSAALALIRLAIYIRAHWLRMPPPLLARHLLRKLFIRFFASAGERNGAGLH